MLYTVYCTFWCSIPTNDVDVAHTYFCLKSSIGTDYDTSFSLPKYEMVMQKCSHLTKVNRSPLSRVHGLSGTCLKEKLKAIQCGKSFPLRQNNNGLEQGCYMWSCVCFLHYWSLHPYTCFDNDEPLQIIIKCRTPQVCWVASSWILDHIYMLCHGWYLLFTCVLCFLVKWCRQMCVVCQSKIPEML